MRKFLLSLLLCCSFAVAAAPSYETLKYATVHLTGAQLATLDTVVVTAIHGVPGKSIVVEFSFWTSSVNGGETNDLMIYVQAAPDLYWSGQLDLVNAASEGFFAPLANPDDVVARRSAASTMRPPVTGQALVIKTDVATGVDPSNPRTIDVVIAYRLF